MQNMRYPSRNRALYGKRLRRNIRTFARSVAVATIYGTVEEVWSRIYSLGTRMELISATEISKPAIVAARHEKRVAHP